MGNMYAHNNPVQRVDNSERTVAMCIYKVSYRIGFFIDNDYKSVAKLHHLNEIFLRSWEKNKKNLPNLTQNADLPGINHKHRPTGTFSVVVGGNGELARQHCQFLVIKMPFKFQFDALPDGIVVQVPYTITKSGIDTSPHLVLITPDGIKINERSSECRVKLACIMPSRVGRRWSINHFCIISSTRHHVQGFSLSYPHTSYGNHAGDSFHQWSFDRGNRFPAIPIGRVSCTPAPVWPP